MVVALLETQSCKSATYLARSTSPVNGTPVGGTPYYLEAASSPCSNMSTTLPELGVVFHTHNVQDMLPVPGKGGVKGWLLVNQSLFSSNASHIPVEHHMVP
jgi:hypothetical protein